ncbi:glycoside hydrolase family 38 C-terminal domain-containing protein [Paenibacillus sinopodophylli]|uniref:glycoside hydrolase family 38 N-terminal domain-containing protein n=1 Tax=Paenibacillus sinopodophylli TaxID=1837342 RepID=UPI00110D1DBA|nr:alpha-mannosidase [Paenibacillus sinopodophylli]
MRHIHLLCNAHLDPVWQWEWEEGAAAAVSTFRSAAQLCEEYEGFVFNHNEVILYKWIEEYEPELFVRIQKLVKQGKWNIIGGWYLQPDCNMPSGESIVRQILLGRSYFKQKFDAEPTTAVNFDTFGHSRGLVQILKKSGFDSYIFMRPDSRELSLPAEDFTWVGFDGSEIAVHRIYPGYNSAMGKAAEKIDKWMDAHKDKQVGLIAWGVGNHGGGPSRLDLDRIGEMMSSLKEDVLIHSNPEAYFQELREHNTVLPKFERSLNPNQVGCYTSQIRIKQKHRLLENETYLLEKMLSSASIQGYMTYPASEIHEVHLDLATAQFHDILPGSSVEPVEQSSLRIMDHGLEIVSRLRARAFFALMNGQSAALEGEIPIMVYNPHPFRVAGIFECEFVLADQNWGPDFAWPVIRQNGNLIASQVEKQLSNLNFFDWRKRVSFYAVLEPSQMNRFDCSTQFIPEKPKVQLQEQDGKFTFVTEELEVVINASTGLMDKYCVNGRDFLKSNAFLPLVIDDDDDAWGMAVYRFSDVLGQFELMTPEAGAKFSGTTETAVSSVRVIEDGEVRTVVEVLLQYGSSAICQTYKLPKRGTKIQVQMVVHWNEKSKMLKLSIPTPFPEAHYLGQTAYGIDTLPDDGSEAVSQKWSAVASQEDDAMFTCINDGVYGSDYQNGEVRISLLRSPGYTGHSAFDDSGFDRSKTIMLQDRYSPRIDIGERNFNFWFDGGRYDESLDRVDREALIHNEKPVALSVFPSGAGVPAQPLVILGDQAIQLAAFKKVEFGDDYIIRLFEPTGRSRTTVLQIPLFGIEQDIHFNAFEIKTFRLSAVTKSLAETGLMED